MKYIIPLIFVVTGCNHITTKSTSDCHPTVNSSTSTSSSTAINQNLKKPKSIRKNQAQSTTATLLKISNAFSNSGWVNINRHQIPSIGMSGMTSPFLRGFQSPNGSQIFFTKYKISDKKPRSADYIHSITDMSAFNKTFQLSSPPQAKVVNHSNRTKALHHTLIGNGDGNTLFVRNGIPTRSEAAYIPLQFNATTYSTLIIDFRGKTSAKGDYQQFLQYIDTLTLPANVKPLLR